MEKFKNILRYIEIYHITIDEPKKSRCGSIPGPSGGGND